MAISDVSSTLDTGGAPAPHAPAPRRPAPSSRRQRHLAHRQYACNESYWYELRKFSIKYTINFDYEMLH